MRILLLFILCLLSGCSSLEEKLQSQIEPVAQQITQALLTGNVKRFSELIASYEEGLELFYLNGWGGQVKTKKAALLKIRATVTPAYYQGLEKKCRSDFVKLQLAATEWPTPVVYQGFSLEKYGNQPGPYAYVRLNFEAGGRMIVVKFATYKTLGRWTLTDSPYLIQTNRR